MKTTDRVTVVVLTYNRSQELCRCLAHLHALPERPRIVVVDNASTDDTAERVRGCFPGTTLVTAPRNLGAAGRNLGVDQVRTPYVAFSDDDTWWAPGSLQTAADLFERHPRVAVLNARILVGPEGRTDPACTVMSASPLDSVPGLGPRLTGFMAGANIMRTHAFREAGGYWHDFFIGGEEALLAMDILDAGWHIVYAPALQVHHWPSPVRDSFLRRRLLVRNAIWTAWLRLPWRLAWRQTRESLHQIPERRLRWQAAFTAVRGAGLILPKRRTLRRDTCELLERVYRHDAV